MVQGSLTCRKSGPICQRRIQPLPANFLVSQFSLYLLSLNLSIQTKSNQRVPIMCLKDFLVLFVLIKVAASSNEGFIFNGFSSGLVSGQNKSLELAGVAEVSDGLCRLTNTESFKIGHAFYSVPFRFKNSSNTNAFSFSTTFVFAMVPENFRGHGMAFVLAPSQEFISGQGVASGQHLGLFNRTNNGNPSNHIVAVELDTFLNQEFGDPNGNHVGIDINSLSSVNLTSANDVPESGLLDPVDLVSGEGGQLWVEYDGAKHQLNVTLSRFNTSKPEPLLSVDIDLSPFILDQMYVGFSSATAQLTASSYVLGWSFQIDGKAEDLDLAKLPSVPSASIERSGKKKTTLAVGLSIAGVLFVGVIVSVIFILKRKKDTFVELVEDWEFQFGPHRFAYKDLFIATRGFNEKELLGQGGFGQVFRGELPGSKVQIAVKRIFHKSQQGMKEFIAEIGTIGRLRHPNLARLLGYCRSKDELLLVYDFMPNGSLDKFLYNKPKATLNWNQRFSIIKDVATALAYLHEGWAEVIIHRDIKASNVLLDGEFNGKLGDFGLARCSKLAQDPQTTHVAGTFGYMAPELAKTGKASTSTDVYAFGAFCLEVTCGRRPIKQRASAEEVHLVDWVFKCWKEGDILKTADSKLENDFKVGETDLVLKLGLLCSHNVAAHRPRMSQVILYLRGQASLPENLDLILHTSELVEESSDYSAPSTNDFTRASVTITESFLSRGR
ncbi:Concanavalin A-like lectin protein kinase family protein, putative [Theobroma cacao]|uniref:non-specific serine/threonine protein kinase n=1 Tax=Theobroma cacao TaxID=3641 RepID=A0A061ES06_THECC|nr:Concanavalin A-like lectin protein kinase family protein, putative [Theobroma cacao]